MRALLGDFTDRLPSRALRRTWRAFVIVAVFILTGRMAAEVVDVAVWPTSVEIAPDEQVQFYAAVLYSDGTISCEMPPSAPGALYESGSFAGGCDSAIVALQDTIVRALRYRWARQPLGDHDSLVYEIQVRRADLAWPASGNLTQDSIYVFTGGDIDSVYWARAGACYYLGLEHACGGWGDSVSARFPIELTQPWVPLPVQPVLVDTTQVP